MLLELFGEDFVVGRDSTIGAECSRRRRNRIDGVPISLSIKLNEKVMITLIWCRMLPQMCLL
jgi:hypothetical protein